ncbi:PREDICTED: uncharacterized protein LOC108555365 [Eufriesea mexicana]|uniref:uncharacterized protein LOC108555365 n=1 Tax=Eufriesea mexicana TaxID=516756 RepID=UPI00083BCA90|nr:PREDICTED: uncharacterized protein LOC108555365 [Eufriesea mexicana]
MWVHFGAERISGLRILVLLCLLHLSVGSPAEQPTRFTLSTGEGGERNVVPGTSLNFQQGRQALASENNVIVEKSVALSHGPISSGSTPYPPVTNTLVNARETVRLENETAQRFLEKPVPKPIAGFLESFLKPTPLVDGIKEQEKYGNSGDKFIGIGRALVSGFEGFSNFLNTIVDFPRNAAKKTSRGITEALNQVGARLVGLD